MAAETVEFGGGGDSARRFRWARPNVSSTTLATAAAVLGFVLAAGAELLPWMTVTIKNRAALETDGFPGLDETMGLTQLAVWQAPAYYLTMTGLLALTAVLLLGRPAARHGIAAAALGCAAGQAVLLTGLFTATREGNVLLGAAAELQQRDVVELGTGLGFYSSAGAVVLLAGAAVLSGWVSFARRQPAPGEEPALAEDGPRDLVVVPVETFERPAGNL